MSDLVQRDAEEFGVHVKAGGWRLGLLVARNVEKGAGQGARQPLGTIREVEKVSAAAFAKIAGITDKTVMRYLSAWDHAAADGLVPPAHTLTPGQDLDLDLDNLGDWKTYYPPAQSLTHRSESHRKAIEAAAAEEGTTPEQVQRASASKAAFAAAIKADPKIAETALRAIEQRNARPIGQPSRPIDRTDKPTELVVHFRNLHKTVERLIRLVLDGHAVVSNDEAAALLDEVHWLRNALDYIESGLNAGSLDKALTELLETDR